jgi:gluconolactonase
VQHALPGGIIVATPSPQLIVPDQHFPEGPCFDREGNLYWVNATGANICMMTPDGAVSEFVNTDAQPNGAAFAANGDMYVCEPGLSAIIICHPDRTWETHQTHCDGEPLRGPNDLVFDPHGGFYFTDPGGSKPDNPIGTVHYVTSDGKISTVAEGLQYPNGIAMTDEGGILTVVETYPHRIWAYDVPIPGVPENGRVLWQHRSDDALLDGMAYDEEGNLWVACYGVGEINVVSGEGETLAIHGAGGLRPTNCCFGGTDFTTLYITEVETNALYTLETGVRGQVLYPDLLD